MSRNLAFQHSCLYVLCLYLVEIILVFLTFNNKFPSGTTSEVIFATAVLYLTQFNWVQYSWKEKQLVVLDCYSISCGVVFAVFHTLLFLFFFVFFFFVQLVENCVCSTTCTVNTRSCYNYSSYAVNVSVHTVASMQCDNCFLVLYKKSSWLMLVL